MTVPIAVALCACGVPGASGQCRTPRPGRPPSRMREGGCANAPALAARRGIETPSPWRYATYLGGGNLEGGNAVAVDGSGNAYVTGCSFGGSPNTAGAYRTAYGGGGNGGVLVRFAATMGQPT